MEFFKNAVNSKEGRIKRNRGHTKQKSNSNTGKYTASETGGTP